MAHIMSEFRQDAFNKGDTYKSYGCIGLPQNVLDYMVKNNAVNDSLYVIPQREGNYIYESEDEGHPLKVQYNNAPTTIEGKHYATPFKLNVKYNTGY